jgi:circadian clock protein KaiC
MKHWGGIDTSMDTICSTGITELDALVKGGLHRSRLYLVQGVPGAGKTTLALQFFPKGEALKERCLYIASQKPKTNRCRS